MGCHAHVELFPFFHCLVGTRFSHQLSTHIERVTKRDFSCMKSHCGIFVRFSVTIIFEPFSLRLAEKNTSASLLAPTFHYDWSRAVVPFGRVT